MLSLVILVAVLVPQIADLFDRAAAGLVVAVGFAVMSAPYNSPCVTCEANSPWWVCLLLGCF